MITEPEMTGPQVPDEPGDVVGDARRPWPAGRFGSRPWVWALGAAAVTSAVWAGVLHGTGYGHAAAPDLHGYRLGENPCTNHNLRPLAGDLPTSNFAQGPATVVRTAGLDHAGCSLAAMVSDGSGWTTTYTMTVVVDLHRANDPAPEFDAFRRTPAPVPDPVRPGTLAVYDDRRTVTAVPGPGDAAFRGAARFRQDLYVHDGGALMSLTLDATDDWDSSRGPAPADARGDGVRTGLADTTAYRKDMVPTLRRLMASLTGPS